MTAGPTAQQSTISRPPRELAHRKLPEVDALIARAQAMRAWLLTATDCSCSILDACALFEPAATSAAAEEALHVTRVAGRSTGAE